MNQLWTARSAGSPVALAAVSAGLLVAVPLLLQVVIGLGAASIGGNLDSVVTLAVTFRGCAVLLVVAFVAAFLTTRGRHAATRSTLTAVLAGATVAYLVLATLSPGQVTLARLISDAPAICLITDGVLFLAAALAGIGFSVWRHAEACPSDSGSSSQMGVNEHPRSLIAAAIIRVSPLCGSPQITCCVSDEPTTVR